MNFRNGRTDSEEAAQRPVMNKELVQALWSLKEDAAFAYKQALEGEEPNLVTLGAAWKNIERVVMQLDLERKQ